MVSTKVEVRLILMNMVYVPFRLVVNYSEAERKNRALCAGLRQSAKTADWWMVNDVNEVDFRTATAHISYM